LPNAVAWRAAAAAPWNAMTSPCLRAPDFLGVHTVALGEELALDDGALKLVVGAAAHNE